jgi:hypothetical protein
MPMSNGLAGRHLGLNDAGATTSSQSDMPVHLSPRLGNLLSVTVVLPSELALSCLNASLLRS